MSHTLSMLSREPLTTSGRACSAFMQRIVAAWPARTCRHWPVRAFHTRTVRSLEPLTTSASGWPQPRVAPHGSLRSASSLYSGGASCPSNDGALSSAKPRPRPSAGSVTGSSLS